MQLQFMQCLKSSAKAATATAAAAAAAGNRCDRGSTAATGTATHGQLLSRTRIGVEVLANLRSSFHT
jgi:hypothetical protein